MIQDLEKVVEAGWGAMRDIPGYITEREARFLMRAIALAPVSGTNVEIGSFKGRSTAGLAYIARHYGLGSVVAIDPHTCPSAGDPSLGEDVSTIGHFTENLSRAGLSDVVDARQAYAADVAKGWHRPIRFLWIDGDHSYPAVQSDLRLFKPFLVDGAIVVMHDVLSTWEGPLRVFDEEVLRGRGFGPAGFYGTIAWTQYRPRDGRSLRYRIARRAMSIPVRRLIAIAIRAKRRFGEEKLILLRGVPQLHYKFWRALLPHGARAIPRFEREVRRRMPPWGGTA
ncbi:MAG TPA: class I SAM-dependent methyltransferase [Vicinamibacterales bacterium]